MSDEEGPIPCHDFNEFEEALNVLRKDDDNIVLTLNKLTTQDECASIWRKLTTGYELRERGIHKCIDENAVNVEQLEEARKKEPRNATLKVDLLTAQKRLSNMKSEVAVETIVKNRSLNLFKSKCPSIKEAKAYKGITRPPPEKVAVGPMSKGK